MPTRLQVQHLRSGAALPAKSSWDERSSGHPFGKRGAVPARMGQLDRPEHRLHGRVSSVLAGVPLPAVGTSPPLLQMLPRLFRHHELLHAR
jgi:hypothetical protein